MPYPDYEIEQLRVATIFQAKLHKFAAYCRIPLEAVQAGFNLDTYVDPPLDELMARLTYRVYGFGDEVARKVEETVSFNVPATWWDAFKLHFAERWWMRWYVRRRPVQYMTLSKTVSETVTAQALLPDVPFKVGKHEVRFLMTGGMAARRIIGECRSCGRETTGINGREFCAICWRTGDIIK